MVAEHSAELLKGMHYTTLTQRGQEMFSNYAGFDEGRDQSSPVAIGDIKISWKYVPCEAITIMAQQMENDSQELTFRQWNPSKPNVPFGEDNGSSTDATCPVTCICCFLIEKCFKAVFQEVIDYCSYGTKSAEDVIKELHESNASNTSIFRWVSWIMSTLGHYLLFSPIIALFAWIPLVGSLLAAIVKFAAIIFALLWATMVHFLVLGLSWIVYRPLYGLLLLSGVAVCIGLMQYNNGKYVPEADGTTPASTLAQILF